MGCPGARLRVPQRRPRASRVPGPERPRSAIAAGNSEQGQSSGAASVIGGCGSDQGPRQCSSGDCVRLRSLITDAAESLGHRLLPLSRPLPTAADRRTPLPTALGVGGNVQRLTFNFKVPGVARLPIVPTWHRPFWMLSVETLAGAGSAAGRIPELQQEVGAWQRLGGRNTTEREVGEPRRRARI